MLCGVLRRESWRRLSFSARVAAPWKGQPSCCFHDNRFITEGDYHDDVRDQKVMVCSSVVGMSGAIHQGLFYGSGSLPMPVSEVIVGEVGG